MKTRTTRTTQATQIDLEQNTTGQGGVATVGIGSALLATARGFALALLGLPFSLVLFVLTTVSMALAPVGIGVLTTPPLVAASRAHARLYRRLARDWAGVTIPVPYRSLPPDPGGLKGVVRRYGALLRDSATWRDHVWLLANASIGFVLGLLPLALLAQAIYGWVLALGVWRPIVRSGGGEWYGFVHVTDQSRANLAALLALAFLALGLTLARPLLRAHAGLGRKLLGTTRRQELAGRVATLTETRTDVQDVSAAELRRIERDLHDGAQARLVAMGMSLGAIEHLLETDPAQARLLLAQAREASATALTELRDLVRGIHPPVLAERGLGDAVRALALQVPIPTDVAATLPRLADPVESAAYFSVSEVLANAVKHAGARRIWIDLRHDGALLRMTVGDDGTGGATLTGGTGLRGIARRLATFDGTLALTSPVGGPTVVTMELPCASSSPRTSSS